MAAIKRIAILTLCCTRLGIAFAQAPATIPAHRHDGIAVAGAAARGVDTTRLTAMEQLIRDGTLRRVTSVLLARRGELLYESYFGDGGPDVLNNTRSAMKSVTALAVGVAVKAAEAGAAAIGNDQGC